MQEVASRLNRMESFVSGNLREVMRTPSRMGLFTSSKKIVPTALDIEETGEDANETNIFQLESIPESVENQEQIPFSPAPHADESAFSSTTMLQDFDESNHNSSLLGSN